MASHEDDLWNMSDEDLDAAFKVAQSEEASPDTEIEAAADLVDEPVVEEVDDSADLDNTDGSAEDTDDEDNEDGSDQPTSEESDHNTSDKSEDDDVDKDNTRESDEANPDKDADSDDEESPDDTDKSEDEKQPAQSHSFKANGKDYEFTSDEIVEQFPKMFGKAMDYTKKMQAIKPWRKTIDALEGAELSHTDVSLMIDVLKGDKEAINEVLKRTGVDTLELNAEDASAYEAKDYGRNEAALDVSDIVKEISGDAEYTTTHDILSNQWDEKSWETVTENPEMIKLLHTDVKSGMYATLQPIAEKLKVFGGSSKSDLDYYKQAAQQHFQKTSSQKKEPVQQQKPVKKKELVIDRVAEAKAQTAKRTATKTASAKRKAAAPTKSVKADSVVDYLDESDEKYDEWYKQLQNSM